MQSHTIIGAWTSTPNPQFLPAPNVVLLNNNDPELRVKAHMQWNIIAVLVCTLLTVQTSWAEKWALLVGVNDYPNFEAHFQLRGCENDVNLIKTVLTTRYGFSEANIQTLLSQNATKANIVTALQDWLVAQAQPGDTVVFYYSGHGVQVNDTNGDEDDGFDEALCPTDLNLNAARTEFQNILVDDELGALLDQVQTDNVTIILDCCHSGTATKDLANVGMSKSRVIDRDLVLVPTAPRPTAQTTGGSQRQGLSLEVDKSGHVVITGCQDHEVSQERVWYSPEVGHFRSGVLTKNLVDELHQTPPFLTYADLMARVRQKIGTGAVQTPQLHGDIERPIFSTRQVEGGVEAVSATEKPYVRIENATDDRITINAGSLHGVTRGSVYAVYTPAEMRFSGTGFANIQVASVDLETSTAVGIGGRVDSIAPMCRAVETHHAFVQGNLYLYVTADAREVTEFGRALTVDNVVIVPREEQADFTVRLRRTLEGVNASLIAADGRTVSQATGRTVSVVAANFQRIIAREVLIKLLRSIRNPNPPFGLKVWVDKGDNPVYPIGEVISMSFRAERDCYLILLNVDSEGYVTMLFPNRYHLDNEITAGKTYTIPSEEMKFKIRTHGPGGRELVMALATTKRLSHPIFNMQMAQAEIFADLSGAKLGTKLVRLVGESLQEDNPPDGATIALPTEQWVTDSLIVLLSK